MAFGRPDWHSITTVSGKFDDTFIPVKVDVLGVMLSRMQAVGYGSVVNMVIDDLGDNDPVTNWEALNDGLDPVQESVFVKQGTYSMKCGIDADKSAQHVAWWRRTVDWPDLSNYQHKWIGVWVYFETREYLKVPGTAFAIYIGTNGSNMRSWVWAKGDLALGWNFLQLDLDNPATSSGTIDWSDLGYVWHGVVCVTGNTHDFVYYIDSFLIITPNPNAGNLMDLAVDENGMLLAKMTGEYAGLPARTIAVDKDGVMKANLSAQDLNWLTIRPAYGEAKQFADGKSCPAGQETQILSVSGRGVTYGGYLKWISALETGDMDLRMYIDDVLLFTATFTTLKDDGFDKYGFSPIAMIAYDPDASFKYVAGISREITFETSLALKVYNPGASAQDVAGKLYYALVPGV